MPNRNKRLPSVYKGSYNTAKMKQIEQVKIPDKITCDTCKKPKTPAISFSTKQIMDYKNGVATGRITKENRDKPIWATCIDCVPKPRTEMICIHCQHWKDLEGFSKAQRRTPDSATCVLCMEALANAGPAPESLMAQMKAILEESSDEEFSDDETNPYGTTEAGDSDDGVPLSGPSTAPLNDENLKNVPSAPGSASAWKTYAQSGKPQEFTGYDGQGNARRVVYEPSIATEDSFVPTRASRKTDKEVVCIPFYPSSFAPTSIWIPLQNHRPRTIKANKTHKKQKQMTSKFAKISAAPSPQVPQPEYIGGKPVNEDDDTDDSECSFGYM